MLIHILIKSICFLYIAAPAEIQILYYKSEKYKLVRLFCLDLFEYDWVIFDWFFIYILKQNKYTQLQIIFTVCVFLCKTNKE